MADGTPNDRPAVTYERVACFLVRTRTKQSDVVVVGRLKLGQSEKASRYRKIRISTGMQITIHVCER